MSSIVPRNIPHDYCPENADFWVCDNGSFIGCCSHDPCHDTFCYSSDEGPLHSEFLRNLNRRDESTVTITLTLVPFNDPVSGSIPNTQPSTGPTSSQKNSVSITSVPSTAVAAVLTPVVATPKISVSISRAVPVTSTTSQKSALSSSNVVRVSNPGQVAGGSTSASSTNVKPLSSPVAGAKRSKSQILGLSIGIIATAIVTLVLFYCCISRKRRSMAEKASFRAKNRRRSRISSRIDEGVDVVRIAERDIEPQSPMTPGGAKLEEQRGRMLRETTKRFAYNDERGLHGPRTISNLNDTTPPPIPVMRIPEHPARNLGWLGPGLVHPAYRESNDDTLDSSNFDLANSSRISLQSTGSRFYEHESPAERFTFQDTDKERYVNQSATPVLPVNRNEKALSWTPGHDVINVSAFSSQADHSEELGKPKFSDVTSKWAAVKSASSSSLRTNTSPGLGIGKAFSTLHDTPAHQRSPTQEIDSATMAMSTENDITSPVEEGGSPKPKRRTTYRGFEEMLAADGRLRAGRDGAENQR